MYPSKVIQRKQASSVWFPRKKRKKEKLGYSSPSSQSKKVGSTRWKEVESVWPRRPEILVSVLGGSCRFWAFNSAANICSKAFYFAQINSVIPSGLEPGWAYKLYLLQIGFFFFLFLLNVVVNREDICTLLVMFPSCLPLLVLIWDWN